MMQNGQATPWQVFSRFLSVSKWALPLLVLASVGCAQKTDRVLQQIKARGSLIVLTRNAPTTYYVGRDDQPQGPEYALASAYAKSLGVTPKFVIKDSIAALMQAMAAGEGDMVAAGLTRTAQRDKQFDFGPSYQQVTQQVVCRRGGPAPDTVDDLVGLDLEVVADSSYVARLDALKVAHPKLHWRVDSTAGTEQLLRKVWSGKIDCTVADSDIAAINRRYFPNLVIAFDLSKPQSLAWVVPKGASALKNSMQAWLSGYRDSGQLKQVMTRYYGQARVFDYVDTRAYVRKIKKVYPTWAPEFTKAADTYDLPPMVLAAQAYQESHWDPRAVSPTGVRGMMMLTRNTAAAVGVDNRLDPRASIRGGAKYLARIRNRLSDTIQPEDRIWFALAAYNVGLGHVRDARVLAKRLGKDPDRWSDVDKVMPLLSEREYYHTLKHGYARGLEPVRYIHRIRNYADILRHQNQQQDSGASAFVE